MSEQDLTLLIIPHSELVKHDLLNKIKWQYVCAMSSYINDEDIDNELADIREFFGQSTSQPTEENAQS